MATDKYGEKRAAIFAKSLEASHEPKWGYFGYTGPLAIGDNSLAPSTVRKPKEEAEEETPNRNMMTQPPRKGATQDVYFSFAPPLCIGDTYVDPMLRTKREKCKPVDPEMMFKPPGKVKYSTNKLGYEYVPHQNNIRDPQSMHDKYKDYTAPKNFFTSPAKKGGGGVLTPGVLFGDGEERKLHEYMGDDYDAPRKQRRQELEAHRAKLQEQHFKGVVYGGRTFANDMDTYHNDEPSGIPREKKPNNFQAYPHELPFKPAHPAKKGYNACLENFPEHIPDPIPAPPSRKPPPSEDGPPSWRPGCPRQLANPMPSVACHIRNLRSEAPRSFVRPCV
eukprot:gnl/MRDRNA2_/MRDRNA2_115258_c0_seq1.p1 gnl/MRDRNA2_/MRDRNA2_115258_c0~~gnl/MRDRNA2_/MRDRNA2_115258_c0_seq1.p1  ORF type:complete len:334 (-),score=67.85 gnl/MRDRNA2_/MRDRNA2_115258_c0_seq1:114-1115(-)